MYLLDLETMLAMMREYRRTGMMTAALPAGSGGMRPGGRVEIILKSGSVVSCRILNETGQSVLEQQEALRAVARVGRLDWTLSELHQEPQHFSVPQLPPPPVAAIKPIPRRLQEQVAPGQMVTWTRLQRQVFALVDGKKTVEQIAAILSASPPRVQQTLYELQAMGMVLADGRAAQ